MRSIVLRVVLAVFRRAHVPQRWAPSGCRSSTTVDEKYAVFRPTTPVLAGKAPRAPADQPAIDRPVPGPNRPRTLVRTCVPPPEHRRCRDVRTFRFWWQNAALTFLPCRRTWWRHTCFYRAGCGTERSDSSGVALSRALSLRCWIVRRSSTPIACNARPMPTVKIAAVSSPARCAKTRSASPIRLGVAWARSCGRRRPRYRAPRRSA